jgi:hypothetical protein
MKFTSFNPLIVTKDAEAAIKLFEALGFGRQHNHTAMACEEITNVTMKDANGFHVDIAQANVERDMTIIRMNVDNFEEGRTFLEERGFKNPSGRVVEDQSSKSIMMVSPSGYAFDLCHHIKDHE